MCRGKSTSFCCNKSPKSLRKKISEQMKSKFKFVEHNDAPATQSSRTRMYGKFYVFTFYIVFIYFICHRLETYSITMRTSITNPANNYVLITFLNSDYSRNTLFRRFFLMVPMLIGWNMKLLGKVTEFSKWLPLNRLQLSQLTFD